MQLFVQNKNIVFKFCPVAPDVVDSICSYFSVFFLCIVNIKADSTKKAIAISYDFTKFEHF